MERGVYRTFSENLNDLIKFCKENNRIPSSNKSKIEGRLRGFIYNHRHDPKVSKLVNKYKDDRNKPFSEKLADLDEFCRINKKLPSSFPSDKNEARLRSFVYYYYDNPDVKNIVNKYRKFTRKTFDENLNLLLEFCKRNHRTPDYKGSIEGYNERMLFRFIRRNIDNNKIKDICEKYKSESKFDKNLSDLKRFCSENNRLPNNSNGGIECRLRSFMHSYQENYQVQNIINSYKRYPGKKLVKG